MASRLSIALKNIKRQLNIKDDKQLQITTLESILKPEIDWSNHAKRKNPNDIPFKKIKPFDISQLELPPIEKLKNNYKYQNSYGSSIPVGVGGGGGGTTKIRPKSGSEVKGVIDDLFHAPFTRNLLTKSIYSCKFFSLAYYDKTHYLSRISKSSPAIVVNYSHFNFNKKIKFDNLPERLQKSALPFTYSTCRSKMRKIIRNFFWCVYSADDATGNKLRKKYDGLYIFQSLQFPISSEEKLEFEKNIKECLTLVSNLKIENLENKSKLAEKKVNWWITNKYFTKVGADPIHALWLKNTK